ncbi:Polysaccharide biosynthesis protein [Agreia bicolorata]|uniref:Polysaccharide biosynthesis protein n=2 Tax=Agreia bicolorata TaxID=110935 RepID=A0A1T4WY81_9MICO|nr:Polysaccharide biosynthesis protein [Agreia bicolorata]
MQVATISSIVGSGLLIGASLVVQGVAREYAPTPGQVLLLLIALVAQFAMQPSRAVLVAGRLYSRIAAVDIASTALGLGLAIALAAMGFSAGVLVGQLAITAASKAVLCILIARSNWGSGVERTPVTLGKAIRFGIRVVPLNMGSYLSRSVDSGLMPLFVAPALSATYARSFQLAAVPLTQLQLSLGPAILDRLAKSRHEDHKAATDSKRRLWFLLQASSSGFAILISSLSGVLQWMLFGPDWLLVNVTISAMCVCLPGMAIASFGSWTAQLEGTATRTVGHLLILLLSPLCVVATAASFGYSAALVALMLVGGLIQPSLLSALHRSSLPRTLANGLLGLTIQWLVLVAIFVVVASETDFWAGL